MANPYDIQYTIGAGEAPIKYRGVCYTEGCTITVKRNEIGCFLDEIRPEPKPDNCFPAYCTCKDGFPVEGYRVPVIVPAGETVVTSVPVIEGCAPAAQVCFFHCGECLYVGYDAEPLIDPENAAAAAGGGADPNPTCRCLERDGQCIETLHIHNDGAEDVRVMLSYYC